MSEQEQFEAWWNGDRPTDFTEYGASQWTKAHAYSAWLARASRPREAGSGAVALRDALIRLDKAAEWFDNAGATAVHGGPDHDEGCRPCEAIIDLRLARRSALGVLHPAPTPPASATAGGDAKAANTGAVTRAVGGLLDAWDLSDEDSVVEKVRPHMKAIHRLIERDEFYATPTSAAGREGVARFIEECDERHNHRCACYAMSMENRRCDEAKSIAAIRALLAAEAEGGGE